MSNRSSNSVSLWSFGQEFVELKVSAKASKISSKAEIKIPILEIEVLEMTSAHMVAMVLEAPPESEDALVEGFLWST